MTRKEGEEKEPLVTYDDVVFLDMDDTLWELMGQNESSDWLSKGARTDEDVLKFSLDGMLGIVKRENDGMIVRLKEGVVELLEMFLEKGIPVGIVSDNRFQDVQTVANLFGIWNYFDQRITHIQLYDDAVDGPCNKGKIMQQLLVLLGIRGVASCVVFVDDKSKYRDNPEFSEPLKTSGIIFIQSPKDKFPTEEITRLFE